MKIFGSITDLVKVVLRKASGAEVTIEPGTVAGNTTFQLSATTTGTKTVVITEDATSSNTANKIVSRDASGNFSAGTITASLSGNASTATSAANLTGSNLTGDVTNVANATTVASVGGKTSTQVATSVDDTVAATSSNTASTIVKRDASGNFSAGTINGSVVTSTGNTTGGLKLPVGNATTERPSGTASQLKGMVRYNDTDDVFEGYNELSGWSSIGGGGTTDRVTQVGHSFVVGDVLYLNGSTYAKAKADAANTAEVVGMVSRVIDSDTFEITLSGEVSGLSGLTVGEVYFLSAATAGAVSSTEPSVVGQVSLPVGVANSTTSMYVQPKRGILIGATNVRTQISLANNATTTVQDVSSYEAGELSGWVSIAATTSLKFYVAAQFAKNGAGTDYNISFQTSGDTPPVGFSVTVTSAGLIRIVMPNVTGFASASINYGLNVAAIGATLPLSIEAEKIVGGELTVDSVTSGTVFPRKMYSSGSILTTGRTVRHVAFENAASATLDITGAELYDSSLGSLGATSYSSLEGHYTIKGQCTTVGGSHTFQYVADVWIRRDSSNNIVQVTQLRLDGAHVVGTGLSVAFSVVSNALRITASGGTIGAQTVVVMQ